MSYVSVASNVVPKLCNQLFLACFCGEPEEARAIERALKLGSAAALFLEGNPVPLKWAMSLLGPYECRAAPPTASLPRTTRTAVRKALKAAQDSAARAISYMRLI